MAIRSRETIRKWFRRGSYPLESQFSDWIDSFVHKEEKVPMSMVMGLESTLNSKYDALSGKFTAAMLSNVQDRLATAELQIESLSQSGHAGNSARFVNMNAWLLNDNGMELAEAIDGINGKHDMDEDPTGYYLSPGLIIAFFGETSRVWEIWQWTGNPYSVNPEEDWMNTECWIKLHPTETSGISVRRTSGLTLDTETGNLYVNVDGSTIVIDRNSGKLCVNAANLPLKTINGMSLIATTEDKNIEIIGGSGSGLTDWQKEYLDGLEEQQAASKFAVSLSVSPSSKEIDGTATTIQLTARATYEGQPVAATFSFANDSELTFEADQPTGTEKAEYVFAVPSGSAGQYSKSFQATATYSRNGKTMSKTASASCTLYAQCRILQTTGTTAPTAALISAATNKRRNIGGTYDIQITPGQYVWLCVPQGVGNVNKITSGGFAVPFEQPETVAVAYGAQTVNYRCYRISGAPQTSPMSVSIS